MQSSFQYKFLASNIFILLLQYISYGSKVFSMHGKLLHSMNTLIGINADLKMQVVHLLRLQNNGNMNI